MCFVVILMSSLEKTLSFGPHVRLRQKEGGIAVLEVCREPVNSMDAGLWHAMLSALNKAEEEPAVRGLVITSGLKASSYGDLFPFVVAFDVVER